MKLSSHRWRAWIYAGLVIPLATAGREPLSDTNNEISLEELVNIRVTSVGKKATPLEKAPAAVTVVTGDDIRRLGIENVPDALRLVPGMDVAQIDNHNWAVSARGCQGLFANKLLVLVDGRTVYEPVFGGVNWEAVDLPMEDLDRIEVIRGPGATLWGANAVNGVVNIMTKSTRDTQGFLVSQSLDNELRTTTTARYGGRLGTNLYYRVYAKYFNRDGFASPNGADGPDDWSLFHSGARMDWDPGDENHFVLQGDIYYDRAGQAVTDPQLVPPYAVDVNPVNYNNGANVLGRWTRTFSDDSEMSLQAFYAHERFHMVADPAGSDTVDIEWQHRFGAGWHQEIVWGAGYRLNSDHLAARIWHPAADNLEIFTAFAQDDVAILPDRLHFIFGSKFDHNDVTGFDVQPGARLLWTPTGSQTVWASVSRAVRTPDRFERGSRLAIAAFPIASPPGVAEMALLGNPDVDSEQLVAYELGYRVEPGKHWSLEGALFYNQYNHLIDFTPGPARVVPGPPAYLLLPQTAHNVPGGDSFGAELSAQWQVRDGWRLQASYSWLKMNFKVKSGEYDSPAQQARLTSYLDLPANLELNGTLAYVDQLSGLQVPSYLRLDVGLNWRVSDNLELGIMGQNLLGRHVEFPEQGTKRLSEIPRTVTAKCTLRF